MKLSPRLFAAIALGTSLLLFGIFLPTSWYDNLPALPDEMPEPPMAGVTLVRLCFVVEGLLVLLLTFTGTFRVPSESQPICTLPAPDGADLKHPLPWVLGATALALGLRLFSIGSDLWLDEITTVLNYQDVSCFQILNSYTNSNNHLLNTLLIKAMVNWFGVTEWAIRLPAVAFGVLGIPAFYFLSRTLLGSRESVVGAFLLSVSYHHVFFSQNARGYIMLLFWTSLATAFFLRGVSKNRHRDWVLYSASMLGGIATILYTWFVLAGHLLVLLFFCVWLHRRGRACRPLMRRAVVVWGSVSLIGFHLYASVVPQVYVYVNTAYRGAAGGYKPLSWEYVEELCRSMTLAFGGILWGAALALAIMGVGFLYCLRRHTLASLALVSPLLVTGAFVCLAGLVASPRFFIWALPVAYLFLMVIACAVNRGIRSLSLSTHVPRIARHLPATLLALIAALSVVSLRSYYRTPKQPTRESLAWVLEQKDPDDLLICAYLADWGPRFYGPSFGLEEGKSFLVARSREALSAIEDSNPDRKLWLLTTFPRALRLTLPDLNRHIRDRYEVVKSFPATIGDGRITVWNDSQHIHSRE